MRNKKFTVYEKTCKLLCRRMQTDNEDTESFVRMCLLEIVTQEVFYLIKVF